MKCERTWAKQVFDGEKPNKILDASFRCVVEIASCYKMKMMQHRTGSKMLMKWAALMVWQSWTVRGVSCISGGQSPPWPMGLCCPLSAVVIGSSSYWPSLVTYICDPDQPVNYSNLGREGGRRSAARLLLSSLSPSPSLRTGQPLVNCVYTLYFGFLDKLTELIMLTHTSFFVDWCWSALIFLLCVEVAMPCVVLNFLMRAIFIVTVACCPYQSLANVFGCVSLQEVDD